MARKGWETLSDNYRKRLEKSGISKSDYEQGVSLAKARGHSKTPEHPTQKITKSKYPEYYAERKRLMQEFIDKKVRLWGAYEHEYRRNGRQRYNVKRSFDNVRDGKMSNKMLKWAIEADEDELIDALSQDTETFAFIGYH